MFQNYSDAQLADEWGELRDRREALRQEILGRGIKKVAGEKFKVDVKQSVVWRPDTKAIRAEMGEAWLTERSKPAMSTSVNCEDLAPVKEAA